LAILKHLAAALRRAAIIASAAKRDIRKLATEGRM
jgi:hypothetical protein